MLSAKDTKFFLLSHIAAVCKSTIMNIRLCSCFLLIAFVYANANTSADFYAKSCPNVEDVVRQVVWEKVAENLELPAKLLRVQFHDCFVKGCEASVLLDKKKKNEPVEKDDRNNVILGGYYVLDEVKKKLETLCPGIVSCSDIIALAARDALSYQFKRPLWEVRLGRRDGGVSTAADAAANLPPPKFNISQLIELFSAKGLTFRDLIVLSGSHTIGKARCLAFTNRYTNGDSSMNSSYFQNLQRYCERDGSLEVFFDPHTPYTFDNSYYKLLNKGFGLLTSDVTLMESRRGRKIIKELSGSNKLFLKEFGESMVRMGEIGVLTGNDGEIRLNCREVN